MASGTGLRYRILRHHALPLDEASQRQLIEVWEGVQRSTHEIDPFLTAVGDR